MFYIYTFNINKVNKYLISFMIKKKLLVTIPLFIHKEMYIIQFCEILIVQHLQCSFSTKVSECFFNSYLYVYKCIVRVTSKIYSLRKLVSAYNIYLYVNKCIARVTRQIYSLRK